MILVAVLIPNLLAPRDLAFDTGTVSCLKQIGMQQEANAVQEPFAYVPGIRWVGITACQDVNVTEVLVNGSTYHYRAMHLNGEHEYEVVVGTPVTRVIL